MGKQSILIAEDDCSLAKALQILLEEKNYTVHHAEDGLSALKLYELHQPQILLMDIDMSEKNGWEVLCQIREQNRLIPIILMSGHKIEEADSLKSYNQGATFFIRKPFNHKEIALLIDSCLKSAVQSMEEFSFGSFQLNLSTCVLKNGYNEYRLSDRQAKILYLLVKNKNQTVENKDLLSDIWNDSTFRSNNQMLRNIIMQLRKMVAVDEKIIIKSIYGNGYCLYC
jgi:DNA-binding response OmpR family regulator